MTAWPPEVPDPFDPTRTAFGQKGDGTWGRIPQEDAYEEPQALLPLEGLDQPSDVENIEQSAEHFRARFHLLKDEIQKVVVGQEDIVEHVITAMIAGGHVLLESMPGLGKTTLVRSIASALSFDFQRVAFSADLTPDDLLGTASTTPPAADDELELERHEFALGPIFCNLFLADQINRAPAQTRAALFEAMEEKSVTVGGQTRLLPESFFVLATQNPLEEGTLLPPAQLDRFFFSLPLSYPSVEELEDILERTTESTLPVLEPVFPGDDLVLMRDFAKGVVVAAPVLRQIAEVIMASHPHTDLAGSMVKKYVRNGASPRAGQALIMAAKIRALREGRFYVMTEDVLAFAIGVLRHRVTLTPRASLDGLIVEDVLMNMLQELYDHWEK